ERTHDRPPWAHTTDGAESPTVVPRPSPRPGLPARGTHGDLRRRRFRTTPPAPAGLHLPCLRKPCGDGFRRAAGPEHVGDAHAVVSGRARAQHPVAGRAEPVAAFAEGPGGPGDEPHPTGAVPRADVPRGTAVGVDRAVARLEYAGERGAHLVVRDAPL